MEPTGNNAIKAKKQKACLDNDCAESWSAIPPELARYTKEFLYCPYCSEELHLKCSACGESLRDKDYKFCPWCGLKFED
ncbi:MAG: zinc ribbon domain-containing protein [Thermodesulfobacteriota bacterium]